MAKSPERPIPARPPVLVARLLEPFQRFARTESAGGIVLLACTAIALGWANSPIGGSYTRLWEMELGVGVGAYAVHFTLRHLINDGLMTIFFLLVGLEIKREMVVGELSSLRKAVLPAAGAAGGMIVPALIYASLNAGHLGQAGWGIPMATDIAFALGALALLGERVPAGVRVFLAALAIVDDIGAVLVIAVVYSAGIAWPMLALAAAIVALTVAAGIVGFHRPWVYAVLGVALWAAVFSSGIHPTVAGVLLAMTIPVQTSTGHSPLARMEHALQEVVAFGIMPLFALANAGVPLAGAELGGPGQGRVALGVALGLLLGKPVGITLVAWLAVRTGFAVLPDGVRWWSIAGAGILGGIGFTMALFIAGLAFTDHPELLVSAKLGILGASLVAGLGGWMVLARVHRGVRD